MVSQEFFFLLTVFYVSVCMNYHALDVVCRLCYCVLFFLTFLLAFVLGIFMARRFEGLSVLLFFFLEYSLQLISRLYFIVVLVHYRYVLAVYIYKRKKLNINSFKPPPPKKKIRR